jgi:hypothetical protein
MCRGGETSSLALDYTGGLEEEARLAPEAKDAVPARDCVSSILMTLNSDPVCHLLPTASFRSARV